MAETNQFESRYTFEPNQHLMKEVRLNPVFGRIPNLFEKPTDELGRYDADDFFSEVDRAGLKMKNIRVFDSMNRDSNGAASVVKIKNFVINVEDNTIQITTCNKRSLTLKPYSYEINDLFVFMGGRKDSLPISMSVDDIALSQLAFDLSIK